MGIKGLIDLVKDESMPVRLSTYRGLTIVVDVSCWIHRGCYACCMELALGQKTEAYVTFCLKYINMMLTNDIKPILVFDGVDLPAKEPITLQRRRRRLQSLEKGKELLRNGNAAGARQAFAQSVFVTPEMTQNIMKACRIRGVDCIVAPYEADAEIAFLLKTGVAQAVITEDSDLLAFGCEKVLLKVDLGGNALEVDLKRVFASKNFVNFDMEKFRRMCILSGCDYLPDGLPGVGVKRAFKVFQTAMSNDVTVVLKRIGNYLKKPIEVSEEYISKFIEAENTFKYQLVFDPLNRQVKPLNDYPEGFSASSLPYCGRIFDSDLALQISLGNVNVKTMQKIASFSPNQPIATNSKLQQDMNVVLSSQGHAKCPSHRMSIWSPKYSPMTSLEVNANASTDSAVGTSSVYGKPNFTDRSMVKKAMCPPLLVSGTREPNKPPNFNIEAERENLSMYLESNFSNKASSKLHDPKVRSNTKENQQSVASPLLSTSRINIGGKRPRASMENAMLSSIGEGCSVNKRRRETESLMRENAVSVRDEDNLSKSLIDQLNDEEDEDVQNKRPKFSSPGKSREETGTSDSPRTIADTSGRLCIDQLLGDTYIDRFSSVKRVVKRSESSEDKVSEPAAKITQLLRKPSLGDLSAMETLGSDNDSVSQYIPPSKRLFQNPKPCNSKDISPSKLNPKAPGSEKKPSLISDKQAENPRPYRLNNFVIASEAKSERNPLATSVGFVNQSTSRNEADDDDDIVEVPVSDASKNLSKSGANSSLLECLDDKVGTFKRPAEATGGLASKRNILTNSSRPSGIMQKKSEKLVQDSNKQSKLSFGQTASSKSKRKVVKSQYFS